MSKQSKQTWNDFLTSTWAAGFFYKAHDFKIDIPYLHGYDYRLVNPLSKAVSILDEYGF